MWIYIVPIVAIRFFAPPTSTFQVGVALLLGHWLFGMGDTMATICQGPLQPSLQPKKKA